MHLIRHVVMVACVVVLGSVNSRAQLLNGSFENTPLPPNTSENGTAGADWTIGGTVQAVDLVSNNANSNGNTTFGSQYITVFGPEGQDAPATVSQGVANFVAGHTYTLTADFASLNSTAGSLTLAVSGQIFLGATLSEAYTAPAGGPYGNADIPFETATLTFIPFQSGDATISIESLLPGDLLAVDNLDLTDPVVPEPSTFGELAVGFVFMAGVFAWRRRRA